MKAILNGKVYDTETAKLIGEYSNHLGMSDFRHIYEDLYRTKKGAFFIDYDGGANTKYAECEGSARLGSSGIISISEAEAKQWCEEHVEADQYIKIFGAPEEA